MQGLDFKLPDFTRITWVSDQARAVWEERVQRIVRAWLKLEWLSVIAGVRSCGLTSITPQEFIIQAGEWAKNGLSGLPLAIQGTTNYTYSSTPVQYEAGKPFLFRVVVGKPEAISCFKAAYDSGNNPEIGRLLGYPSCCLDFFENTWVKQEMVDTTWPMAKATVLSSNGNCFVELSSPIETNILWRWMGIRAVPHLPCSFECEETIEFAQKLMAVGHSEGFEQEMDWLAEILSWPVEWTALHGIAEIKTPICRVSTRTDASAEKLTVDRHGTAYPLEGAKGLAFPYQTPERPKITNSTGFQNGLDLPIQTAIPYPDWYVTDNGFNNSFVMDRAHRPLIDLALAALGKDGGRVLDLGCGNGALLQKMVHRNPHVIPFGIEITEERIVHARQLLPDFAEHFLIGDMFTADTLWQDDQQYDLVILMPGRLLEADPEQAARLKSSIKHHSRHLLVYGYGDWLMRYTNLRGLAQQAKLTLLSIDVASPASLAKIEDFN